MFDLRRYAVPATTAVVGFLASVQRMDMGTAGSRIGTVPVVVAARDLPEGELIDRVSVQVVRWPAGTQPAGTYSSTDSVVGRVARFHVFRGELLVAGRLAPEGTRAGLEIRITPGKRAYSIRIDDASGFAGMIQPNSRVDVLAMLNGVREPAQRAAKIFMSNVRALRVWPNVQRGARERPINHYMVTLEVTPEEAERLAIAASRASISLVLRGYGDLDTIQTPGATASEVLELLRHAPEPAPVAAPDSVRVRISRGGMTESHVFRARP